MVAARRQDELDSLVSETQPQGGEASAIQADVCKAMEVERMVRVGNLLRDHT